MQDGPCSGSVKNKMCIRDRKDAGQRPACGCVESYEIGAYNTCVNGCFYCYATRTVSYTHLDVYKRQVLPEGSGDGAKLECDEIIKDFVAEPYPLVNYTEEQMDEISKLTVDIYKYVKESWANWIVNGGIENDWDGYIAQLNQMGLERLMEIYQEALDSYNSAS